MLRVRDTEGRNAIYHDSSIIDNGSIILQDFFGLQIEFAGYFMYLVFLTADRTPHAHSPAHTVYFQFSGTFLTFHVLPN